MPKMIFFLIILFLAKFSFASVEVLEKTDGRIVARVNFGEFVYEKGANPLIFLNFTAARNSQPQFSAIPQNRHTVRVPDVLERRDNSPFLSSTMARNIPLFAVGVSPILAVNGNEITYTTEMIVVINYSAGTARNSVPRGSFHDAISAMVLNPDRVRNTIVPENRRQTRGLREGMSTVPQNRPALRFWIGDAPSANDEREADLHDKTGIYRITPSDLQMLENRLGSRIPINSIRIRAANPNVADSITPSIDNLPSGLVDVPFIVRKRTDSQYFEGNDEVLFYGSKIHTWFFDDRPTVMAWTKLFNYTSYRRYYWITVEDGTVPQQMRRFSGGEGGETQTIGDVYHFATRSKELTTPHNAGWGHGDKRWVWERLIPSRNSISAYFPNNFFFNSRHGTAGIKFTAHEIERDNGTARFNLTITGSQLRGSFNTWHEFQHEAPRNFSMTADIPSGAFVDFDGFKLRYSQNLSMTGANNTRINNLRFYSRGGSPEAVRYKISNLPDEFRVLVRHNPRTQITELIDSGSVGGIFEFSDQTANGFKYHLALEQGFLGIDRSTIEIISPPISQNQQFHIVDLLNTSNQADYLIISPRVFLPQAIGLARHKHNIGQFNFPRVVAVEDIFNTFAGGVLSPEAIRNFMVYTQNRWQTINGVESPDYLVLFGSGHFDYKNISSRQPNHIPVYIAAAKGDNRSMFVAYPIDDFFGYTSANTAAGARDAVPNIIIGRIPANTVEEADAYLEKIIALENTNADFSSWRNTMLLVADDDIVPRRGGLERETMPHTWQSDSIGRLINARDKSANVRKVSLVEFPFDNQNFKPLAQRAMIDEINRGVSLVTFFGHASFETLADERAFTINDIGSLRNENRYFIFGGFTCGAGFFDHPSIRGISEALVVARGRGAINTVASSRVAFTNENFWLADSLFRGLYGNTDTAISVGRAYFQARGLQWNLLNFALLGDPSHTPMKNRRRIEKSRMRIMNEAREPIDTLQRMQKILLSAILPINDDGVARVVEVSLQNPENLTPTRRDGFTYELVNNSGAPYQYTLPGMIVTRQSFEFTGNSFEVPLTIPPGVIDDTKGSRFRFHVRNRDGGNQIFTGAIHDGFVFSGWDTTNIDINDKEGPTIAVLQFFSDTLGAISTANGRIVGDRIIIDGFGRRRPETGLITGVAMLDIRFSDNSGIDIFSTDAAAGGISVAIDRVMSRTQFGRDDVVLINDDYRTVSLRLQLNQSDFPAVGEYEMTITARDILQNVSTKRYILEVRSLGEEQYTIGDFFAFPSPVRMGQTTQFFFNQPTDGSVAEISLKIYTLNGRLVRSFHNVRPGQTWDLTDQRGRKLSPNVYLYRLFVKRYKRGSESLQSGGPQTEIIRSRVRKMVIHPPR